MPTTEATHEPIMQSAFAFWNAKTLLTAIEFDLFTQLGDQKMTGPELGKELGIHPRGIYDFFDALVAMKFLERDGEGPESRYFNNTSGKTFLVRTSPQYIGGILEMLNARLFKYWHDLPEALRTGEAQNEVKHGQKGIFETLYEDQPRLEQFLDAMAGISRFNYQALAEKFDFSSYETLCDAGGASGLLCIEVAKKNPHLKCTTFDLPPVAPIAEKSIDKAGLNDRVKVASGSFFEDDIPQADVITMGLILHDWDLEKKKLLVRKAYDALPEGGAFIAIESLIDDARRENVFGLLMSLNMLIETGSGFDYTGADFQGWCREVGFKRFEVLHLAGPASAAIAYK